MSSQFKKFLIFLASIGLGVLTFILLIKISSKGGDNYNAGPALGMLYGPIALISMFIYYKLLGKLLN